MFTNKVLSTRNSGGSVHRNIQTVPAELFPQAPPPSEPLIQLRSRLHPKYILKRNMRLIVRVEMQRAARIERPLRPHVPHLRERHHVLEPRWSGTVFGEEHDAERVGAGGVGPAGQREAVVDEDLDEAAVYEDVEVERLRCGGASRVSGRVGAAGMAGGGGGPLMVVVPCGEG